MSGFTDLLSGAADSLGLGDVASTLGDWLGSGSGDSVPDLSASSPSSGYDLSGFLSELLGPTGLSELLDGSQSTAQGPGIGPRAEPSTAWATGLSNDQLPASVALRAGQTLTQPKAQPSWWDSSGNWLQQLMKGDKETLSQARFGLGALGLLSSLLQSRKARNSMSPAQLQAALRSPYSSWTPGQQSSFNSYFYQPLPQFSYQRPVGLARGGRARGPHGGDCGCAMCNGGPVSFASGGALAHVQGSAPGQSDVVSARLSPGEYVVDADVVSALGDGNNDAGARRLDEMREAVRRHKRGASPRSIPPKARSPLEYLKET